MTQKQIHNQNIGRIPIQLGGEYEQRSNSISIYLNIFALQNGYTIGFLTPRPITIPSKQEFQLFSHLIKPLNEVSKVLKFSLNEFELIHSFNKFLFADLCRVSSEDVLNNTFRDVLSFLKPEKPFINILLVYMQQEEIDFVTMNDFLRFKKDQTYRNQMPEYLENDRSIYVDVSKPYQTFMILLQWDRLKERKAIEYFEALKSILNAFDTLELAMEHYELQFEALENISLHELLLNHPLPKTKSSIMGLRKRVSQLDNDDDLKLVLALNTPHMQQFHPNGKAEQNCKWCSNCPQKCSMTYPFLKLKEPQILNPAILKRYPLKIEYIDTICQLYMAMIGQFKIWAYSQEAWLKIQRIPNLYDVQEAITISSNNNIRNYENLEVLGDSALKYIVSLSHFQLDQEAQESFLTSNRTSIVKNSFLTKLFKDNFLNRSVIKQIYLPYFYKQAMTNQVHFKLIKCQMLKTIVNDAEDRTLTDNQMADMYEALAGICLKKRYNLMDMVEFLLITHYPLPLSRNSEYLIDTQNTLIIKFPMVNYHKQKYPLQEQVMINPFTCNFNSQKNHRIFDQKCPLLQDAITFGRYERLEFLGDAILEFFVISNLYERLNEKNYNENLQQQIREGMHKERKLLCPGMLHDSKIILLDNGFMGTMALFHKYHEYAQNLSECDRQQIAEVVEELKQEEFSNWRTIQKYAAKVPKFMGDLWESVAAAILLDKGWGALMATYGEMYAPYIAFVVDNNLEIYAAYQLDNFHIQDPKRRIAIKS